MIDEFIVFDDTYIVEIEKAYLDKEGYLIFRLKDNIGLFKFKYPEVGLIPYDSWLGQFLWLKEDKYLTSHSIIDIVSTYGEIDTYIVPISVRFIPNLHKKRRKFY